MRPLLLDTCALIWISQGEPLSSKAKAAIETAVSDQDTTYLSPISAWEIGQLVARQRLTLTLAPDRWFAAALARPGVELAPMPPALLIASSFLPGKPPRDPADRIIAATARDLGATLLTRDRALIDYGRQGHVDVVAC